ncbi:MAG: methyl-accepting chemotaxis protein [Gammaproteobacteria bacterium]|nr:methyl-accepting chemotaxis protein [Gammaproteobacteria bacterium]
MRINEPNTANEVMLSDDSMIVSKTDLKGIITMVNAEFIRISGFTEAELIGKNHNLVRHFSMPAIAFQGLWDDLHKGKPWTGLVKNRCKNGDFYWVRANVTPVYKNGRVVEYMSVRSKPERKEIEKAESLYQKINSGKIPKTPIWQRLNLLKKIKIWQKLTASTAGALAMILLLAGALIIDKNEGILKYNSELSGLSYVNSARHILQYMPQHRGIGNAYLNGKKDLKEQLLGKRAVVDGALITLQEVDDLLGQKLKTTESLRAIQSGWSALKKDFEIMTPAKAFGSHTRLMTDLTSLIQISANESTLSRDPGIDTGYLIDLLINSIPVLTEKLGQARGLGAGVISAKSFTIGQRENLIQLKVYSDLMTQGIVNSLNGAFENNADLKDTLGNRSEKLQKGLKQYALQLDMLLAAEFNKLDPVKFFNQGTGVINQAFEIYDVIADEVELKIKDRIDYLTLERNISIALVLLAFFTMVVFGYFIINGIQRSLIEAAEEFVEIANGNYKKSIDIARVDEIGDLLRSLKSMQIKLGYDMNDTLQRANEMQRIKVALDNVSGNVMMADNERNIIYMNKAVTYMMSLAESDIKKDLKNFKVSELVGANIDIFHKDPSHQKQLLAKLDTTYSARIEIGGRTFDLTANPVINANGERLGTAVEWVDRTVEVSVEKEIGDIVDAAQNGNLDARLDVISKNGFFKELSEGINKLIEVISATFNDIARTMEVMSDGDLTEKITSEYSGKYGEVKDNINLTIDKLQDIVGKIRASSEFIRNSSEEISSGNNNLSQRAEEQASTLEETASSMEELTGTVKNNADSAQQANQLAIRTRTQAEQGGTVVKDAVTAMDEITASSEKISEIISVIDEIAFQTNLLALNASVEAARAGEQGRGFAVVATEVRNLAGRSATAAKEIKELITDSYEKVRNGSKLVNESGETLLEIVASVKKVGDIISEIAAASSEQSAGIDQINKAVSQMDEMTQQNAALAEQASAASEASSEKANEMNKLVGFFKTE